MTPSGQSTSLATRPRKPAFRTKTGCKTCKIRRIKCDEGKPWCVRCCSTGRQCDGYNTASNKHGFQAFAVNSALGPHKAISGPQIADDNIHYLEFYHHCAGAQISNAFDRDFWGRTPLQLAQTEVCVRHALIALSHLTRNQSGRLKDARSALGVTALEKPFLFHYNKAIHFLVRRMSDASYRSATGLVCCLLFICIEFLRGDYDAAFAHFNNGLKIIAEYRRNTPSSSARSADQSLMEGSLIPMFHRLIATAIFYGLPTDQVFYNTPQLQDSPDLEFTSILEAQQTFHDIQNKAFILMRHLGQRLVDQHPFTASDLQAQRQSLLSQHAWHRAFQTLMLTTPSPTADTTITAHTLRASHHALLIFTSCATSPHQTAFDAHLPRFKALLHHAQHVLAARTPPASSPVAADFTFDSALVLSLYLTACKCRCPTTRRVALSLLERHPTREGLWDPQQHAAVVRRIVELEEAEVEPATGWPVERARIWSTIVRGDMDARGRFRVYFAIGQWGEGRGVPPLPEGLKVSGCEGARMWGEWMSL